MVVSVLERVMITLGVGGIGVVDKVDGGPSAPLRSHSGTTLK